MQNNHTNNNLIHVDLNLLEHSNFSIHLSQVHYFLRNLADVHDESGNSFHQGTVQMAQHNHEKRNSPVLAYCWWLQIKIQTSKRRS
jgi:hypothetical protein